MRKIGYKLFLGFGVVLSFTLVIVVIIYLRSSHLKEMTTLFVGHDMPEIVMLNDAKLAIVEQANSLHLYLVTGQDKHQREYIMHKDDGRRLLSMHTTLNHQDAQKEFQILVHLWNAYDLFDEKCEESITLLRQGEREKAILLSSTEVNKAMLSLLGYCRDIISLEDMEVRKHAEIITSTVASTSKFVTGMSAVMLLLAGILSVIITRSITSPLEKLVGVMRKASSGDLSVRSDIAGKDEIGYLAESFNQMIVELEKAFTTQKQFLNDASHELRTPITVIKGHLEILGRFGQPTYEEFQETKTLLLDELDRMAAMVKNLLLLARSTEPKFYDMQEIELKDFLEMLFRKASTMSSHRWVLENLRQDAMIRGDAHRLTQVFLNLAENATFHTPPEGEIRISGKIEKGLVCISVADTGEGISEEELRRIFQRFYRVDKARSREAGGTGLGLAIVESIVHAHGGRIAVESEVGRGSTFSVCLPLII